MTVTHLDTIHKIKHLKLEVTRSRERAEPWSTSSRSIAQFENQLPPGLLPGGSYHQKKGERRREDGQDGSIL